MKLKVALLQLLPGKNLSEQLEKGREACERAKQMGADIALFPEMWSCGYDFPVEKDELEAVSIGAESVFIKCFQSFAARSLLTARYFMSLRLDKKLHLRV